MKQQKKRLSICLALALALSALPGAMPQVSSGARAEGSSGLLMMPQNMTGMPLLMPDAQQEMQTRSYYAADEPAAGTTGAGLLFAADPTSSDQQAGGPDAFVPAAQALAVAQPVAESGQLSPGDTIRWQLQITGATSAQYAVSCDGALLEEGALPADAGLFSWTTGQPGSYLLTVTAWDAQGQSQSQTSAPATVQAAFTADLSASHTMCAPGDQVRFVASVSGGTAPYAMRILVAADGVQVAAYDGGEAAYDMTAPGHYIATVWVTDAAGMTASAECEVYCSGLGAPDLSSFAPGVALSGDVGLDMAQIARSQLGKESGRYGQWYDAAFGGGTQDAAYLNGPWDAMFAGYCAHYAAAALTPSARMDGLREDAARRGSLRDASFVPRVGDIVLLRGAETEQAGILIETDGQSAQAVLSDPSGAVASRWIALDDAEVTGFIAIAPDAGGVLIPQPTEMDPAGILLEVPAAGTDGVAPSADPVSEDILLAPSGEALPADTADTAPPAASASPEADPLLPGDDLFQVTQYEAASAVRIESMSPQVLLGESIHWTVQLPQGVAASYAVELDGQPFDSGDVTGGLVSYAPQTQGDYLLRVTAQVDGEAVQATDSVRVISEAQVLDEEMPLSFGYTGGTVDRSVKVQQYMSSFAAGGVSLLEDLEIAYVTCNASTLPLNQVATWTVHATGGTGEYSFRMGLYWQEIDAPDNSVTLVAARSSYSTNNQFSYTITTPGRYVLFVWLMDTAGDWLMWESTMYETRTASDLNDETTVAGKVKAIVASETNSGMTTREKARALHDWLILNADYDYSTSPIFHAEGVLLKGKGVCQSYAQAYRMLCMEAGIECLFVTGKVGTVLHAWNLVNFDGKWLHVDCTWDDTGGPNGIRHTYFGLTDDQMRLDHSWNSDWTNNDKNRIDGIYPVFDPSYPQNIEVTPPSLTVTVGETRQLSALVTPDTAVNKTVTWESADPGIASVDASGRVTGRAAGQTTITAMTHNELWTRVTVTVGTPPPLTGLSLSPGGPVTMLIGNTLQLTATRTPAGAVEPLTWNSASPGVARVSASGLVSAVAEGSTTITVSSGSISASVTVIVNDPTKPTGITINRPSPYAMTVGQSVTLVARLLPSTAVSDVRWASTSPGIATVSETGVVTAVAAGSTTVTVTAVRTGHRAVIQINVTDPGIPTGVTISPSGTVDVTKGNTLALVATLAPSGATSDLTWASSNTGIAAVNAQGVVTAVSTGQATITVTTARGGHTASVTINVTASTEPTGVSLNHSGTIGMQAGNALTLVATLAPSGAVSDLRWTSSNEAVATVSSTGRVTAMGPGTATITVTTVRAGHTASVIISVADTTLPTGVSLNRTGPVALQKGATLPLVAALSPSGAVSGLSWSSSNTGVATVSSQGVVTAIGAGTAVITVTTVRGGRTASVTIIVSEDNTMPTGITLSHTGTVEQAIGTPLTLIATLQPAGAQSPLTWASTMPSVATVSQQGVVTPLQAGLTTITVTATRSGHTASVRMQVVDTARPTGISLNYTGQVTLDLAETLALRATLAPATAQSALTWTSSAPQIATVDAQGRVTPRAEGLTTVTVRADASGHTASVRVEVVDGERPTGIVLSHAGIIDVVLGDALQLKATMIPSTATSGVRWTSSNAAVAAVSDQGLVTPLREGTATITATATKINRSAYMTVRVTDPYKPTGIALSRTGTVAITTAETLSLVATMIPQTAQSTVTWRSSNTLIATVSANGVVTPLREGTVTITATADKIGRSAVVTVQITDPYKPTGITLSHTGTVAATTAGTLALTATLTPATAQSPVTWRSSNALIATVDANGVVTPLREGTVMITATADKIGRSASVYVQITDPFKPTGITLSHTGTVAVTTAETLALVATLTPATAQSPITWRSSNALIATVDANGVVTPLREGTVTITATADKIGRSAVVTVQITDPYKPSGITLDRSGIVELSTAQTLRLTAALTPATAQSPVTWRSTNPLVATVDENGVVTPLTEGSVSIIATATKTGRTAYVTVRVIDPYKPTGILLNRAGTVQLSTADTLPLVATLTPATAQSPVTWRSSNARVATVDANGVVTPLGEGYAQITATATKIGRSAYVTVQVTDPYKPTGITLSRSGTVQLSTADTLPLVATLTPSTARSTVTWRTSNPGVATVDANGTVTPLREGHAQITATDDKTGRMATVWVQVTDPYKPTGIFLSHAGTIDVCLNDALNVRAYLMPATAQSQVTWRSSNESVATVDAAGRITALREGVAMITATAAKINRSAYMTVRVFDPYKPTGISLDRTTDQTLPLNGTMTLRAALKPEYAQSDITWRSSMPQVATVDASGTVTPLREGVTTITATAAKTNHSAWVRITVVDPGRVASLAIGGATYGQRVSVGQLLPLSAVVTPQTARTSVQWMSTSPQVASVDASGRVLAQRPGWVTIIASSDSGRFASTTLQIVQ